MSRSKRLMMWRTGILDRLPVWCLILLSALGSTPLAAAGKHAASGGGRASGIVTILQGNAVVIHALSAFDVLEGSRVYADDIIRTDKDAFLRIEYADKTWLELGPQTSVQISHPAGRRGKSIGLYVMGGWLKLGTDATANAHQALESIGMDLTDLSGIIVMRGSGDSHEIFAEQGSARWINRAVKGGEPVTLNKGDFLTVTPTSAPVVQSRPSADFITAMPRPYRDTLPIRYGVYSDRDPTIGAERAFTYSEVQPWLNAEPQVRTQFLVTWRRKLQDSAFRQSLDSEMSLHHEWDPILHPEKYEKHDDEPVKAVPPAGTAPLAPSPTATPKPN